MKVIFIISIMSFQTACKQPGVTGTEVYFNEIESGASGQTTRMIVTKKFLRIDDGKPGNDFLLFDRVNRVIYSTNSLDQRTLVINAQPLDKKSPLKLENKIEKIPTDAPAIEGKKVAHLQLSTNDQICYDLFAVKDFLPDVVVVLKEYRQLLAGEQAVLINALPKEMLQPCDLANNIFYASRHLEHGFPVRLQETDGRFRELVKYKQDIKIDSGLMKLPEGYTKFTAEEMRTKAN
jgi:hypothetical protein